MNVAGRGGHLSILDELVSQIAYSTGVSTRRRQACRRAIPPNRANESEVTYLGIEGLINDDVCLDSVSIT